METTPNSNADEEMNEGMTRRESLIRMGLVGASLIGVIAFVRKGFEEYTKSCEKQSPAFTDALLMKTAPYSEDLPDGFRFEATATTSYLDSENMKPCEQHRMVNIIVFDEEGKQIFDVEAVIMDFLEKQACLADFKIYPIKDSNGEREIFSDKHRLTAEKLLQSLKIHCGQFSDGDAELDNALIDEMKGGFWNIKQEMVVDYLQKNMPEISELMIRKMITQLPNQFNPQVFVQVD